RDRGGAAVLLVAGPLEGLDLAHALDLAGETELVAHRSIHHAARRLRVSGGPAPRVRRPGAHLHPGQVLLWPLGRLAALPASPAATSVLLAAGDAVDPSAVTRAGAER